MNRFLERRLMNEATEMDGGGGAEIIDSSVESGDESSSWMLEPKFLLLKQ